MKFDLLYNFISPVTGRVLSDYDYVLVGDKRGVATPSPILIDIRLDLINLRKDHNHLKGTILGASFILNTPNDDLPNAQDLISLAPGGILKSNELGKISIAIGGTDYVTEAEKDFLQNQITTLDGIVAGHTTLLATHTAAIAANTTAIAGISATLYTPVVGLVSVSLAHTVAIGALTVTVGSLVTTVNAPFVGLVARMNSITESITESTIKAKVILQTANSVFPNGQALDELVDGVMVKGPDGIISTTLLNDFAPDTSSYIVKNSADLVDLPNAQALDALSSGIMVNTGGVISIINLNVYAPRTSKYIIQVPDAGVPNGQALSLLNDGIMVKNANGVVSTIPQSNYPSSDISYLIRKTSDLGGLPNARAIDNLSSTLPVPAPFNPYRLVAVDVGNFSSDELLTALPLTDLSVPYIENNYTGVYVSAAQGAFICNTLYGSNAPPLIPIQLVTNLAAAFPALLASLALSDVILGSAAGSFGAGQSIGHLFEPGTTPGTSRILKASYDPGILAPRGIVDLAIPNIDYLDSNSLLRLEGDVFGLGGLGEPINTTLNLTLNEISDQNLNNGDVNFNNFKAINLDDPINPQDAVNLRTLEGAINNIELTDFVVGGPPVNGVISTSRGPTCLLTNIPAGGDVDMDDYRIKNLHDVPEEIKDAINMNFLWEFIHGRVEVTWP